MSFGECKNCEEELVNGEGLCDVCTKELILMLSEESEHVRAQVKELQARGTELETERRMWKARFQAARDIISILQVEGPIAVIAHREIGKNEIMDDIMEVIHTIHDRIQLLERDAWVSRAEVVRAFVKAANEYTEPVPFIGDPFGVGHKRCEFIKTWAERLAATLED